MLEKGEADAFEEACLRNPRLLVSSGDTPTMLQEGFRYTAMHVVSKGNRAECCRRLLNLLEGPDLLPALYPGDSRASSLMRQRHLVDLYLNMPDKGNCETPLHFACKFGHVEMVEVLTSHPQCDKAIPNKYGETPAQVICSRAKSQENVQKIRMLLEGSVYVPLIGPEDGSSFPVVGPAWSPDPGSSQSSVLQGMSPRQSPRELPVSVRAYAGPMSPTQADELRGQWSMSPQRSSPHRSPALRRLQHVARSDPDKGMERRGREIAHSLSVPWKELWAFLGEYADFSTTKGVQQLEDYMCRKLATSLTHRLANSIAAAASQMAALVEEKKQLEEKSGADAQSKASWRKRGLPSEDVLSPLSPVSSLCRAFHDWNLFSPPDPVSSDKELFKGSTVGSPSGDSPASMTSTGDSRSVEKDVSSSRSPGDGIFCTTPLTPRSAREGGRGEAVSEAGGDGAMCETATLATVLQELCRQVTLDVEGARLVWGHVSDLIHSLAEYHDLNFETDSGVDVSFSHVRLTPLHGEAVGSPCIQLRRRDDVGDGGGEVQQAGTLELALHVPQLGLVLRATVLETLESLAHVLKSRTPVLHVVVGEVDCSGLPLYVTGPKPTKVDRDVLLAMSDVDVTSFPAVSAWRHRVDRYDSHERDSWCSPATIRHRALRDRLLRGSTGGARNSVLDTPRKSSGGDDGGVRVKLFS